jgi:sporulation protein YabP
MIEEKTTVGMHKLVAEQRQKLNLSGVVDVISFDPKEILLETTQGMLTIKGGDLHVNHLSVERGDVFVEGRIDGLLYSDVISAKAAGSSLLERLFK